MPTNNYYRSLIKSILLIVVVVPFMPMILVSGILLYQFHISYKEKVHAHLGEVVQKGKQSIDIFLKEKLGDIRFLAEVFSFEELREESFLQDTLKSLQLQHGPVFVDLGVVNEEGLQVAYAGPIKLGNARYSDADWYQEAMNADYIISDVSLGLRDLPHFIIAVRKGRMGKQWILRATIDYEALNRLVEDIRIGKAGSAFILNRDGQYQTRPLHNTNSRKGTFLDSFGIKNMTEHEISIVQRTDDSGHKNICVATFLKDGDWLLIYQQRASDAFSGLRKTQTIALVIISIVGALIVAKAFGLSKKMVRRIALADKEKEKMNEQMFQTGKLASVGELAAGIAHEINNPIAIMVEEAGWIDDLLEEEEFREGKNLNEFRRALKQIRTQGKRCKEITHKLLSFARKTDSRVQEVQLNELIEDIIDISTKSAKYGGVAINTNIQKDLPAIEASQTELQQVLLNLINNALDAMEKKGGTMSISAQLEEDNIVIEVSDNGPGIPKDNLARIFDPFFTTKPVGKGTGLGLSICYGIIKKLGGEISVRSVIDIGTTFRVIIPLSKDRENNVEGLPKIPDSHQEAGNLY